MTHTARLRFSPQALERINRLLNIESLEDLSENELAVLDAGKDAHERIGTAFFDNGKRISFDLCSGSSNYWLDITLKDADWSTIMGLEPAFELSEGNTEFVIGDDIYIVQVVYFKRHTSTAGALT